MTPAQKYELYYLAQQGHRRPGPSTPKLVREGYAIVRGDGFAVPTSRGIAWLRRRLAKDVANALRAHNGVLPEHLAEHYEERQAVLRRWSS